MPLYRVYIQMHDRSHFVRCNAESASVAYNRVWTSIERDFHSAEDGIIEGNGELLTVRPDPFHGDYLGVVRDTDRVRLTAFLDDHEGDFEFWDDQS